MTMFKLTIELRRRVVFRVLTNIPCLCVCICQRCQITIPPPPLYFALWARHYDEDHNEELNASKQKLLRVRNVIITLCWCWECECILLLNNQITALHAPCDDCRQSMWMDERGEYNFWLLIPFYIYQVSNRDGSAAVVSDCKRIVLAWLRKG